MERIGTLTLGLLGTLATAAAAQLPDPSGRAEGLAGAYSARARGYEAAIWNPANLALSDRPGWSVGLPGAQGFIANNALSYGQLEDLYGTTLDDQRKSEILAEVREDSPDGMFEMAANAGANWLGLSIGPVAVGVGTTGTGTARLSSDAVELILFGNVGEDGQGRDFSLDGSRALAWGVTTVFASYAHALPLPVLSVLGAELTAGATFKYVLGHGLARFQDQGSILTRSPLGLEVEGELINSTSASSGAGWAVDVGGAMKWGPWTVGLSVQNLARNMSWTAEEFEVTTYTASASFDSTASQDTTRTFAELTPAEQERVNEFLDESDFPTRFRLGAVLRVGRQLSVSADYREVIGGTLHAAWDRGFAVGAEFNALGFLPLRAGAATNFKDMAYSAGMGLYAGPVHVDLALSQRGLTGGGGLAAALSMSVWPGMWH